MKTLVWSIFGMFFAYSVGAQITFEKQIGGDAFTAGESVLETQSGAYVVTGQTPDQGVSGNANLYLVKTDTLGDTCWTKSYGGIENDFGYSVVETSDGGFAVCGVTEIFDGTQWQNDAFLVRTDINGDSIWTRHYGGPAKDITFSIQQTFDEGFILAGVTESFGNPSGEAYLIRTDPAGDTMWTRHYLQGYANRVSSVKQTPDGGFILCGQSQNSGSGTDADVYMLRVDANGDSVWAKTFGGTGFETGNSVIITPDGGFLCAGSTQNNSNIDIYLVKTDASGASGWTKAIGGVDLEEANCVVNAPGGGYLLAGTRVRAPSWFNDVYILKVDNLGDTLWTRVYGGARQDAAQSLQPTSDGGIIIAGFSDSFGVSRLKLYLLKTDASGVVSRPPEILPEYIHLYPNPLTERSVLEVPGEIVRAKSYFTLYDHQGRPVREAKRIRRKVTSLSAEGLSPGVYYYRISDSERVYAFGRILVE